jgi:hypothetical protein
MNWQPVWQGLGWLGAAALLGGYVLVSTGRLSGKSLTYNVINIAGALFLTVAGWAVRAWPSVTLNIVWVVIGLKAIRSAAPTKHS